MKTSNDSLKLFACVIPDEKLGQIKYGDIFTITADKSVPHYGMVLTTTGEPRHFVAVPPAYHTSRKVEAAWDASIKKAERTARLLRSYKSVFCTPPDVAV